MDSSLPSEIPMDGDSSTQPSTPIVPLSLSIVRNCDNGALQAGSNNWQTLRTEILIRDNYTCSSCAYISPDRQGTAFEINHRDGDASNNDLSNLQIHCPPCEAIRQGELDGLEKWLCLANSNMEQAEIVRRTREIFERSRKIPSIGDVDPLATPTGIDSIDLANDLVGRKDLREEYKCLRRFFTQNASGLFAVTLDIELEQLNVVLSSSSSDIQAGKICEFKTPRPWISYTPRVHSTIQDFIAKWPPSSTSKSTVAWIYVRNGHLQSPDDDHRTSVDLAGIDRSWNLICANRQPTVADMDDLAKRFQVLEGKWMVFAYTRNINFWWSRIATATHAGTLGISAKVSPRDDSGSHVICVYTRDYTDETDVYKVRQGLYRLGMRELIGYKPDIHTYCGVYEGNSWHIPPTRYQG